jgi:tRNA pseudouridine38-40 synthase
MPPRKILLAVNAHLPEDIRVRAVRRVSGGRHARFDAVGKEYRYHVWNHAAMNPLLRGRAWHVPRRLDLGAMRAAAAGLVGRHDFRSFAANRGYVTENTVRTLSRVDVRRQGELLTFVVVGDGFLYKMVRGLVGTLVQVGLGKIVPGQMARILAGQDRRVAGMTAPAHGLVLWKVRYPPRQPKRGKG